MGDYGRPSGMGEGTGAKPYEGHGASFSYKETTAHEKAQLGRSDTSAAQSEGELFQLPSERYAQEHAGSAAMGSHSLQVEPSADAAGASLVEPASANQGSPAAGLASSSPKDARPEDKMPKKNIVTILTVLIFDVAAVLMIAFIMRSAS